MFSPSGRGDRLMRSVSRTEDNHKRKCHNIYDISQRDARREGTQEYKCLSEMTPVEESAQLFNPLPAGVPIGQADYLV